MDIFFFPYSFLCLDLHVLKVVNWEMLLIGKWQSNFLWHCSWMKINRDKCVCVYITYMCRLWDNSLTQVSGAHYQQQIITSGANVSDLHRHSRWYRANNFRRCVQTFRKFTCYENVPLIYKYFWLNDYVYVNMCIENDFKRNIAPSNQYIVRIFTVQ